ncbi:SURF1 family protein [Aliisedimentitalea scapharcae]|uniref:SURF1-like protein n=1 Tax=Aliisedimentitalea scapharcae TaxID=1524259 RepID=A0ABZ2XZ66_9RHOB
MRRFLFVIFGLVGLGILLSLGTWQVRRLAWKEAVLSEIETRIAAAPVALPVTLNPEADRYLPVQITGELLEGEIHVLVSLKRVGAGYRVIAPMATGDRVILVDRGFIDLEDKDTPRTLGEAAVTGNLHWPQEIDSYTPDPGFDANIWFARDVDMLSAALGTEPVLVIARSKTDPAIMPLPVSTTGIPNDHLQYVITWYGLALVWASMMTFFFWRTRAAKTS